MDPGVSGICPGFIGLITATPTPINQPGGVLPSWIPAWLKIAGVLLGGGSGAYLLRQYVERRKLKRALKTEIKGMSGLENCRESLQSREKPSSSTARDLEPKDVPSEESIPTQVYESNIQRLGLLKESDLEVIVDFYTEVLGAKSVISEVRSDKDVPEPDQNELWESIGDIERKRQTLFGEHWIEGDEGEEEVESANGRTNQ